MKTLKLSGQMRIIQLDAAGECEVEEREPMHKKLRVLVDVTCVSLTYC